ncbi:MAG: AbrB/MazE/SpoVT family DNA-binding domain-containing protein [Gemmatimonadota bacterium]|nr:AbrB/MazE/SpoVT family DNA-binding domain-containing protein [Gemmatimonadota bacterium]
MEYDTPHGRYTAKVEANGRIVIPAVVREALGLRAGDEITLLIDGDDLVLRSRRAAVRRVRERLAAIRAPESSGTEVDEFLSDRAGYWESAMAEDGPPVRVDLPSVLQKLRRPS